MNITFVLLALLVCGSLAAYDFTKPNDGNELKATLKDERDTTFIVFFRTDYSKLTTDEGKKNAELTKNITEEVKKKCTDQGLKDTDYTWVDVEIELTGTAEKDDKRKFGKLLADLGFEDKADAGAPKAGADKTTAPAGLPATDPKCKADPTKNGGKIDAGCAICLLKEFDKNLCPNKESSPDAPVPLTKLAVAPYALVIRN